MWHEFYTVVELKLPGAVIRPMAALIFPTLFRSNCSSLLMATIPVTEPVPPPRVNVTSCSAWRSMVLSVLKILGLAVCASIRFCMQHRSKVMHGNTAVLMSHPMLYLRGVEITYRHACTLHRYTATLSPYVVWKTR